MSKREEPTWSWDDEEDEEGEARHDGARGSSLMLSGPVKGPDWRAGDRATVTMRTEHEPLGFTPAMAALVLLGRALGDPTRVRILALLAEEERAVPAKELAERLETTARDIAPHLGVLRQAGLVREERQHARRAYTLDAPSMRAIRERHFADDRLGLPSREEMRAEVLAAFFRDGRLTSIPMQKGKRRYVLEELARAFHDDTIYDEHEVNALLDRFHDDTAQLRRLLVEAGLLARDHGRYWVPRADEDGEAGA